MSVLCFKCAGVGDAVGVVSTTMPMTSVPAGTAVATKAAPQIAAAAQDAVKVDEGGSVAVDTPNISANLTHFNKFLVQSVLRTKRK